MGSPRTAAQMTGCLRLRPPITPYGLVGGVQLPGVSPGAVHGGTFSAVTRAKSPVERISLAILDARSAETFGVNVNESVLVPPDPLGTQDVLRFSNLVRYRSPASEPPFFSTTTISWGCPKGCAFWQVAAEATTGGRAIGGLAVVEHPATPLSNSGRQTAVHVRPFIYEM
jgi:hypothetical protein